jgi:hypothetical protein
MSGSARKILTHARRQNMSEPNQPPIIATEELAARILARSLAVIDYLVADELRLREYVHSEFTQYTAYAKAHKLTLPTGAEFTHAAMQDMAYVRQAIAGLLTSGSVAPKAPEIGQYL